MAQSGWGMRLHPECLPCFLSTSLRAAALLDLPWDLRWRIAREVARLAAEVPADWAPIQAGEAMQRLVQGLIGERDPFARVKDLANRRALELLPVLRRRLATAPDPLEEALRLAVAGNLIDFGVSDELDLEGVLRTAEGASSHFHYADFHRVLEGARSVLYIGDNTGEIVFDRLVVEELLKRGKEVTFVVRSGPALNDATLEDAEEVGLTGICRVIPSGAAMSGVFLPRAGTEFRRAFREADLVLSKGMGNFEGLSDVPGPIFFLLVAKCVPVARELGVEVGEVVFRRSRNFHPRAKGD